MMKRIIVLLLMVLLLVVSPLIGCSSGGVTNPIGLVPKKANMVGQVSLSKILQDNDLWGIYNNNYKYAPQTFDDARTIFEDDFNMDLKSFQQGIVFADVSQPSDGSTYWGVIVEGTFNKNDLIKAIRSWPISWRTIKYKDYDIYTYEPYKAEDNVFAFLSDNMLVIGTMQPVKDVIDVKKGDAKALSGELLDTYNKLGNALIKVAMAVPPNVGEGKLGESATRYLGDLSAFDKVKSVGMTLSKNDKSVALDVKLCCTDSDSAQSIEQTINGLITFAQFLTGMSENQQQNQALDTLLNKVKVTRSDTCVSINITATLTEIEDLIQSYGQTE
jgi:hypothetical protein